MKAKIVKASGGAKCRACVWGDHLRDKKPITKNELCLEIQTVYCGPTRYGYLCGKHAQQFRKNLNKEMEKFLGE